jgi:acyl-CoA dehydrogenase
VLAAQTLAEAGQEGRLAEVVAGDAILTVALEPGSGSVDGDRLTGEWPSVPALHVADAAVVFVGDDGFLVETGAEGVSIETAVTTSRGKVGHLRLDGTPATALGAVRPFAHDRALVMLAAVSLGACEEATRMAAEYTSTREQFGKPLSTNQGVVLKAADAYIAMNAMRATLWAAAWRLDEGLDSAEAVEVAHWWASEGGHRVVHITQHLHGGMGADIDYPVHRYFLWAKEITDVLGGPSAHLARLGDLLAAEAKEATAT